MDRDQTLLALGSTERLWSKPYTLHPLLLQLADKDHLHELCELLKHYRYGATHSATMQEKVARADLYYKADT